MKPLVIQSMPEQLMDRLHSGPPVLALAPMQDVTDVLFLRLMAVHGGADLYFTEYFRVYAGSCLNREILRSITENPTGQPVIAQLIGNDIAELVRSARELQEFPVAGIDLNLGCPAPVVYRKCAGGGLLRQPERVDAILGALREVVRVPLTVKMRLGFDSVAPLEMILPLLVRHRVDLVTVHGRTVKDMYRAEVRYDLIARAVAALPCPVFANGNIHSARKAADVLAQTGARGLMIGRGAIRNPWIFQQIRQMQCGEEPWVPSGRDVLSYIGDLFEMLRPAAARELAHVTRVKKHMNYLGLGVDLEGRFLHEIRRVKTEIEFFEVCRRHLDHERRLSLEPFAVPLRDGDVMAGAHG